MTLSRRGLPILAALTPRGRRRAAGARVARDADTELDVT
jgi:hypothetical protein